MSRSILAWSDQSLRRSQIWSCSSSFYFKAGRVTFRPECGQNALFRVVGTWVVKHVDPRARTHPLSLLWQGRGGLSWLLLADAGCGAEERAASGLRLPWLGCVSRHDQPHSWHDPCRQYQGALSAFLGDGERRRTHLCMLGSHNSCTCGSIWPVLGITI